MGRTGDFFEMLKQRRIGFKADETMKGTHRFLVDLPESKVKAGDELPFFFKITWGNQGLASFLNPLSDQHGSAPMEGLVTAGGITGEAPLTGAMELRYFKDATIRYTFTFPARGRRWGFAGEKSGIRPWNLHRSHTLLRGTLTDLESEKDVSEVEVYFQLRQLRRFLTSFRLG